MNNKFRNRMGSKIVPTRNTIRRLRLRIRKIKRGTIITMTAATIRVTVRRRRRRTSKRNTGRRRSRRRKRNRSRIRRNTRRTRVIKRTRARTGRKAMAIIRRIILAQRRSR